MPPESSRPVSPEELLAHAPWVRALARQMLHDGDLVEDAVQHTWMAAMRSPPRERDKIRAWIRVVVRNFARESYRSDRGREARERLAARTEAVPATDELYERALRQRQVVTAVLELDEASRTVLLLRYFDDLPPREIAKRLGIPVETANTRLKRGRERLRERLASEADEEGVELGAILLPLARMPDTAATGAGAPSAARRAAQWGALAAAVAAGVVASVMMSDRSLRPTPPVTDGATAAAPGKPGDRPGRTSAGAQTSSSPVAGDSNSVPAASGAAANASLVDLYGRLTLEPGATAETVTLRIQPVNAMPTRASLAERTVVVAPGEFTAGLKSEFIARFESWHADDADVTALNVVPDHPDLVPARVQTPWTAGHPVDFSTITLRRAGIVTGSVANAGNAVVAAAFQSGASEHGLDQIDEADVAPDGSFRLRVEPGKSALIVVLAPGHPPQSRWTLTTVGAESPLGSIPLPDGVSCAAHVTAAPGISLARAIIQVNARATGESVKRPWDLMALEGETVMRRSTMPPLDGNGDFRADGLQPGPYRVLVAVPGLAGDLQESLAQDVTLPHAPLTFAIDGEFADIEVAGPYGPAAGARVWIRGATEGAKSKGPVTFVLTDAEGRARIIGARGHSYALQIESPGFEREPLTVSMTAGSARSRRVELRPVAANASWDVLFETEAPERIGVGFFAPAAREPSLPIFVRNVVRRDGGFHVEAVPPGRYRVVIRPGTTWEASAGYALDIVREVEFAPGGTGAALVASSKGGRLRLTARDEDGHPLQARVLVRDARGVRVPIWMALRDTGMRLDTPDFLSDGGPSEVSAALVPGAYTVEFSLAGRVSVRREVQIDAGATAVVDVTLVR